MVQKSYFVFAPQLLQRLLNHVNFPHDGHFCPLPPLPSLDGRFTVKPQLEHTNLFPLFQSVCFPHFIHIFPAIELFLPFTFMSDIQNYIYIYIYIVNKKSPQNRYKTQTSHIKNVPQTLKTLTLCQ